MNCWTFEDIDIILLFLAKPLGKHGITLVHITYPLLTKLEKFVLLQRLLSRFLLKIELWS